MAEEALVGQEEAVGSSAAEIPPGGASPPNAFDEDYPPGIPKGSGPVRHEHRGVPILVGGLQTWGRADGSVYIGSGALEFGIARSLWLELPGPPTDAQVEYEALGGRVLRVKSESELPEARALIDRLGLHRLRFAHFSEAHWRRALRTDLRAAPLSACRAGLLIKVFVLNKPGSLGNFLRIFPAALVETSVAKGAALPVGLPMWTPAEQPFVMFNMGCWQWDGRSSFDAAFHAWTWLCIMGLNYMFAGGSRMLARPMLHSKVPDPQVAEAQSQVLNRVKHLVSIFLKEGSQVDPTEVENKGAEKLFDYWGEEITVPLKLTLKGLMPALPKPGTAVRVPIETLVSEESRRILLDPASVRLPENEVMGDIPRAPVHVESDAEYNSIVTYLVELGLFEQEVPEETVRHKGEPVYIGLFGVHKGVGRDEGGEEYEILRLIANCIPTNMLQRVRNKHAKRMGYAGLWCGMVLHDGEIFVEFSEDQVACFHQYVVPQAWRGYFVVGRKADGQCFKDKPSGRHRPRMCSCPMGWCNVVDFLQEAHMALATDGVPASAGLPADQFLAMRTALPSQAPAPGPRNFFSIFIDNWDQFSAVQSDQASEIIGAPSPAQLALRSAYDAANVVRDPRKAAEGTVTWESLGAQLRGDDGLVGTNPARRMVCIVECLLLCGADAVRGRQLLRVTSLFMFLFQFARWFMAIFGDAFLTAKWLSDRPHAAQPLPAAVSDELFLAAMVAPLLWTDLRAVVDGEAVCTDASPGGGGICTSVGLSDEGAAMVSPSDSAISSPPPLVIATFAGIGAASMAFDLLEQPVAGHVAIEKEKAARKCMGARWPDTLFYPAIEDITAETVNHWRESFPKAKVVYHCFGFPCVDVSKLNAHGQGLAGRQSGLLFEALRVDRLLREHSWEVRSLAECVASMSAADLQACNKAIGVDAIFVEGGDVHWTLRPRLYWLKGFEVGPGPDAAWISSTSPRCADGARIQQLTLTGDTPTLDAFLEPDTKKGGRRRLAFLL